MGSFAFLFQYIFRIAGALQPFKDFCTAAMFTVPRRAMNTRGIWGVSSLQGSPVDTVARDADVHLGVKVGLRVDHPATSNHDVILRHEPILLI